MKPLRRLLGLAALAALSASAASAHPLGNFSINHYSGLRVGADGVEVTYVVDMAEIPAFQEIHGHGLVPDPAHPSVAPYLHRAIAGLGEGLRLEVNGARLALQTQSSRVSFPPGAGELPTLRIGAIYRAALAGADLRSLNELHYRDENFPGRAGWKEIVAVADVGATLASSSAPERDRSRVLSDYPTDLLESPPQELEALRRQHAAPFLIVTPGIRGPQDAAHDQKRIMSIGEAFALGADYVVVGRPLLEAADPAQVLASYEAAVRTGTLSERSRG
jgi:hypothetical protein